MSEAEQHLRRIDREWNEAYPNRDIEALNRIIADDWKCIDGTGRVISKQQLLERVSTNPNPFASHEFDEFDLRIFGETAIVTGRLSAKGRNDAGDFSLEQRYIRVYVRRVGIWRAVATQVTIVSQPDFDHDAPTNSPAPR
jgi:ketosteroid isomerase-like protein